MSQKIFSRRSLTRLRSLRVLLPQVHMRSPTVESLSHQCCPLRWQKIFKLRPCRRTWANPRTPQWSDADPFELLRWIISIWEEMKIYFPAKFHDFFYTLCTGKYPAKPSSNCCQNSSKNRTWSLLFLFCKISYHVSFWKYRRLHQREWAEWGSGAVLVAKLNIRKSLQQLYVLNRTKNKRIFPKAKVMKDFSAQLDFGSEFLQVVLVPTRKGW